MVSCANKTRHWRYFLLLEEEFERALRYVEPEPENLKTFSLEFARQLVAICAEFEAVGRLFCQERLPESTLDGIDTLQRELLQIEPELLAAEAIFLLRDEALHPFERWEPGKPPTWWTAYNKLKHDPAKLVASAKLANVRDAVAGLGLLTTMYVGDDSLYMSRLCDLSWATGR